MFQSMRMLQSADLVAQSIWVGFARPNLSAKIARPAGSGARKWPGTRNRRCSSR
jgi:hypothetical protein